MPVMATLFRLSSMTSAIAMKGLRDDGLTSSIIIYHDADYWLGGSDNDGENLACNQ